MYFFFSPYRRWKEQFICLRHSYELFKMSGLSSRICSWLSSLLSHSISDCTNYGQSLGVKCSLTHPFSLLNLVLLSQVPETNQPTRTKQNFRNVVFSTNKKYNPTDWRFWCYRNCSHFCSSFVHSLGDVCLGEQTSKRETGRAVLTVLNRLNNGQPIFSPLLSTAFIIFVSIFSSG